MKPREDCNLILDIPAASRATGVPVATIYRWVSKGLLTKIGRPAKVSTDDVEQIRSKIKQHAVRSKLLDLVRIPV